MKKIKNILGPEQKYLRANFRFGFTLIELLVVVLIVGILAAVALPQYQKAVAKSRYTQLVSAGKSLKDGMEAYYLANGDYPQQWSQLDINYSGCVEKASRYLLICDKFVVDMFAGANENMVLWDKFGFDYSSSGDGGNTVVLNEKSPSRYTVWLDHSAYPNKTECLSKVSGLCKSMGY